jgi:Kef-type K+ transport system membrane component KefB
LAFVVGVAQAKLSGAIFVCVGAVAFIAAMFVLVRPLVVRVVAWVEARELERPALPLLMIAVLAAAWLTEVIGIHAVFGAFVLGAVIPHDSRLARDAAEKLRDITTVVLLPAFFAVTGMNTRIDLISGWDLWLVCGAIIAVATLGKFGGTVAAARFSRVDWRTSAALGILMNTRGLMELIVLNIGLSLGVISPTLFAMMVLMALATTMATSPILKSLLGERDLRQPTPA